RLRRVEVEVAWTEVAAAVRGYRSEIAQYAVVVLVDFEKAGVFGFLFRPFVAARDEHHVLVVGRHAHLVREDRRVYRPRLLHLFARREILVDAIDAQRAGVIERDEDVLRRDVGRHVDRPRRQLDGLAVLRQRAGRRIDPERSDVVLGAGGTVARSAAARRDVEIPPPRVRPRVLHARRQLDAAFPDQLGLVDVDVVVDE